MATDESRGPGGPHGPGDARPPDPMQYLFDQVRGMTEQFMALGKLGASLPTSPPAPGATASSTTSATATGLPALPPLPWAITAAQLGAVRSAVVAQRSSVHALRSQLDAFDEQLGILESILGPLADWSTTWADVEKNWRPRTPGPDRQQGDGD